MKIEFDIVYEGMVYSEKKDNGTLAEAVRLLNDRRVISISVTKQTPSQFFDSMRGAQEGEEG